MGDLKVTLFIYYGECKQTLPFVVRRMYSIFVCVYLFLEEEILMKTFSFSTYFRNVVFS